MERKCQGQLGRIDAHVAPCPSLSLFQLEGPFQAVRENHRSQNNVPAGMCQLLSAPSSSARASPGRLGLGCGARARVRVAVTAAEAGGATGLSECNSSPNLMLARLHQQESRDVRVAMSPLGDCDRISELFCASVSSL